jgi:hypothetical protein
MMCIGEWRERRGEEKFGVSEPFCLVNGDAALGSVLFVEICWDLLNLAYRCNSCLLIDMRNI